MKKNTNISDYIGLYKDGKRHGQGTLVLEDGSIYVGEFKNGMFNGQGTFTYYNGDKYIGNHKDDNKHGQGTYTFANGEKQIGEWKEDRLNGQGTAHSQMAQDTTENSKITNLMERYLYDVNKKISGEWKDGKFIG